MGGTGGVLLPEYDEMGWLESQSEHKSTHSSRESDEDDMEHT